MIDEKAVSTFLNQRNTMQNSIMVRVRWISLQQWHTTMTPPATRKHGLPIPEFAPVTMTTLPVKSRPCSISMAVVLPSYFCLVVGFVGLSSTVNASLGSKQVVLLFIWLQRKGEGSEPTVVNRGIYKYKAVLQFRLDKPHFSCTKKGFFLTSERTEVHLVYLLAYGRITFLPGKRVIKSFPS